MGLSVSASGSTVSGEWLVILILRRETGVVRCGFSEWSLEAECRWDVQYDATPPGRGGLSPIQKAAIRCEAMKIEGAKLDGRQGNILPLLF
jgi:hypothetical protein